MAARSPFTINPGFDLSRTAYAYKLFDLDPIPAGAFGPGSDPFTGRIDWASGPLVEFQREQMPIGSVDTIVSRPAEARLEGEGSSVTIPVQMVALNFASIKPIEVTFDGGARSELWNADAVAPRNPEGSMMIRQDSPEGGLFDSEFEVHPIFTFTRLDDGFQVIVDVVAAGLPPNVVKQENIPWRYEPVAESNVVRISGVTSNFVPGYTLADGPILMVGQAFSPDNPRGMARGAHGHFCSVETPPEADPRWLVIPPRQQ